MDVILYSAWQKRTPGQEDHLGGSFAQCTLLVSSSYLILNVPSLYPSRTLLVPSTYHPCILLVSSSYTPCILLVSFWYPPRILRININPCKFAQLCGEPLSYPASALTKCKLGKLESRSGQVAKVARSSLKRM